MNSSLSSPLCSLPLLHKPVAHDDSREDVAWSGGVLFNLPAQAGGQRPQRLHVLLTLHGLPRAALHLRSQRACKNRGERHDGERDQIAGVVDREGEAWLRKKQLKANVAATDAASPYAGLCEYRAMISTATR